MTAQSIVFESEFLQGFGGEAEAVCAQRGPDDSVEMRFIENAEIVEHVGSGALKRYPDQQLP